MDTHKRTVVKTITFKFFTTAITALYIGIADAILLHIVLTFVYWLHERIWLKIKWGKIE